MVAFKRYTLWLLLRKLNYTLLLTAIVLQNGWIDLLQIKYYMLL